MKDPNAGDTLTYGLTGDGANHFAVKSVDGGVKVVVAQGANLQQVAGQSFGLALTVSDGKDVNGNVDPSVDDSIAVMVEVLDFTVSLTSSNASPSAGQSVTLTITVENPPVPESQLRYLWYEQESDPLGPLDSSEGLGNPGTKVVSSSTAASWEYSITFFYGDVDHQKAATSATTSVTWYN